MGPYRSPAVAEKNGVDQRPTLGVGTAVTRVFKKTPSHTRNPPAHAHTRRRWGGGTQRISAVTRGAPHTRRAYRGKRSSNRAENTRNGAGRHVYEKRTNRVEPPPGRDARSEALYRRRASAAGPDHRE